MATVSGPPVSLNQARSVFGAGPGSLAELRRGAGRVPNIPQNGNVPTGFPMNLLSLAGATNYVPMSVSVSRSGGDVFRTEPAPSQVSVSGSLTATATNGTGSYSYGWAYVGGGSPSLSWSLAAGGRIVNATDNVNKNDVRDLVFQLTISDGVSTYQQNHTLRLTYSTDL